MENGRNQLERENERLKEEIERLNKKITNLNLDIENYKEKINLLKTNFRISIEKTISDKQLLEMAINGDIQKIEELQKIGVIGEFLKPKDNIIQIDANKDEIIGNQKFYKDVNFIDFYDVIIDIKSIKDINKGWNVKLSKRAEENYEQFMKEPILKFGVIGNSNKGKSFLLSKISKINLPSGTSIRTEGLSVKYPETELHKDRKIALLDSAGLETPVLKNVQGNEIDKEFFKEKSREKIITELFMQNYIINNSDILIIVVGILTYSEQKLINRIKNEIHRAKLNKKNIFIIHNLITYTSIEQVENYIKEFLLNSATFNLKEGHNIRTGINQEKGKYFSEENSEYRELNIYHLIFANEGSEAGKFYNYKTLNFIENSYQNITNLDKFDVIATVKDRFLKVSQEIIEKNENELTIDDFDNSDKKVIKLKSQKDFALKKCLIDELGFSNLKGNGFDPTYNYYRENEKIIIKIESPGISAVESYISNSDSYPFPIIKIKGIKNRDKKPEKIEDNIYNSREYGQFSLDIPFRGEDEYYIKNEEPEIEEKHGILLIKYKLEKKLGKKIFNVKTDDDL